ncbi:MAG: AAA domain-containing protein, partial [Richelia sp. RM2_1_2]|nr:AAA domain-containing protein [Richelia sp. RM2_1_2]
EKGRIDPLIGREYEVNELVKILARRKKNNPVLRGEAGVGKTAIPEGLARMINDVSKSKLDGTLETNYPDFPEFLINATIWSLEIGSIVAGTKFRGEFEEKLKDIINAIVFLNNEMNQANILFIDEIHTALGAGSTSGSSLDAGNILKPALTKGTLRTIGSTTFDEYKKYFEKDRALARRFRPIDIYEPSDEACYDILVGLRSYYEDHHGVTFTNEALEAAIRLTKRYISGAYLPDKAIDAIDSAGATQRVLSDDKKIKVITEKQIQAEVARMARIPDDEATKSDTDRLDNLAGQLGSVVFGQDTAITALEDSVYLSMAGLRPHNKTRGAYLFGGPTGVGKTEVAKKLSQILGIELHRFNMSEYMEKHTVSRLIGAPPGYVGFDSTGGAGSGLLTDAVDKQPHSIVLLDEVDKAHPDVFNILLQVMDDGKLTNSIGKTIDFRNVILIMTTNAGASDSSRRSIGIARELSGFDDTKQLEAIEKFFTPEFRNRLDGTIIFNRLSPEVMLSIVDKFISELNVLSSEKKVTFVLDDNARTWLAREGYDALYGARPLSRVIQTEISIPCSRQMLFGKLKNGGTVKISTDKRVEQVSSNNDVISKDIEKIQLEYEPLD